MTRTKKKMTMNMKRNKYKRKNGRIRRFYRSDTLGVGTEMEGWSDLRNMREEGPFHLVHGSGVYGIGIHCELEDNERRNSILFCEQRVLGLCNSQYY